jgi:hypothetical protein
MGGDQRLGNDLLKGLEANGCGQMVAVASFNKNGLGVIKNKKNRLS